jgi:hypothetical protein
MTTEELAVAGLPPVEEGMQGTEIAQPSEENSAADGSENREEGEIRSEGENIEDVNVDLKDLVVTKRSKPLPPSFVLGGSKVTANLIREYEAAGFFPVGSGRAPLDEEVPTPEADKLSYFVTTSPAGLDSPMIPSCLLSWSSSL